MTRLEALFELAGIACVILMWSAWWGATFYVDSEHKSAMLRFLRGTGRFPSPT